MNASKQSLSICLLLIMTATLDGLAAVDSIYSEFTGQATETWESFSRADVMGLQNVLLPIFDGQATITGPYEFIWISQIGVAEPNTGGFGLGYYAARSHDGTQGYRR